MMYIRSTESQSQVSSIVASSYVRKWEITTKRKKEESRLGFIQGGEGGNVS
jgi:hypothetical protein